MAVLQLAAAAGKEVAKYAPEAVKAYRKLSPQVIARAEKWYKDTVGANRVNLEVAAGNPQSVGRVVTSLLQGGASIESITSAIPVITPEELQGLQRSMQAMELQIRDRGDARAGGVVEGSNDQKVAEAIRQRMISEKVRDAAQALGAPNVNVLRARLNAIRALDEGDLDAYVVNNRTEAI